MARINNETELRAFFQKVPHIETERLILRPFHPDDAKDVFEYASIPEASIYVTWEPHTSEIDSLAFVNASIQSYIKGDAPTWAIVLKESNKVIGAIHYAYINLLHKRCELGYSLSPHYWNKGLTTEATRKFIDFTFSSIDVYRIEARAVPQNIGSWRVMEKCGLELEGISRAYIYYKGKTHDHKLYAITRYDWEQAKPNNS